MIHEEKSVKMFIIVKLFKKIEIPRFSKGAAFYKKWKIWAENEFFPIFSS
jgi:hypothetical protein